MKSSKLFLAILAFGAIAILIYSFREGVKTPQELFEIYKSEYVESMLSGPAQGYKEEDLQFYPYNTEWLRKARFEPSSMAGDFFITMTDSTTETLPLAGKVIFDFGGNSYSLLLFDEGESFLLPFNDFTNATETYGGGRYLNIPKSSLVGDEITLDFNRVNNFYCAYTPSYVCPLPPVENNLQLGVRAGERIPLAKEE